jgi:hypothetical protein
VWQAVEQAAWSTAGLKPVAAAKADKKTGKEQEVFLGVKVRPT